MHSEWDVAVIGGGGAGLAAALSAARAGSRVVLFESQRTLGGSTQASAGMFTAAGTSVQRALGVADSPARFFQHYMDLNQWKLHPGIVRRFCEQAAPTFEWMLELGVSVPARLSAGANVPGLGQAGVEDVWRGHIPLDEGYGIVDVLHRRCLEAGVDIILSSPAERLLVRDGRVVGLEVDGVEVRADAVVVASGGFAANPELVERYYPGALEPTAYTFVAATDGSVGDHIRFAEQAGAKLYGHNWGLRLITASFQRYHHWRAGFPPVARVYVNADGDRFVNEDVSYAVAEGIFDRNDGYAWAIFDELGLRSLTDGVADWTPARVLDSVRRGESHQAMDVVSLARTLRLPAPRLEATLRRWNDQLPQGRDDDFLRHETLAGKQIPLPLPPIATAPFYAVRMLPGELVCTHTGIAIDRDARALTETGQPIPGLFAAGESGAGVLGERYVGGGNSIANALTFGRLAGIGAARCR